MIVCDKCGSVRPDWVHYWAEFQLNCFIGSFIWVCYLLRPMDYFRDMQIAFEDSRERCLGSSISESKDG
jgi:hypothetical protein